MTSLKQRNAELLDYQTKQNKEMVEIKAQNYQLVLQTKEFKAQIDEQKEKLEDQNAELQCARKYFAEAGPEAFKKYESIKSSSNLQDPTSKMTRF